MKIYNAKKLMAVLLLLSSFITMSQEKCGICKQSSSTDMFWFTSTSRTVHQKCFDLIQPSEAQLWNYIEIIFPDRSNNKHFNYAHVTAIQDIEIEIENAGFSSIKAYMDAKGTLALKTLFDTTGAKAVARYADQKDVPHIKAFAQAYLPQSSQNL